MYWNGTRVQDPFPYLPEHCAWLLHQRLYTIPFYQPWQEKLYCNPARCTSGKDAIHNPGATAPDILRHTIRHRNHPFHTPDNQQRQQPNGWVRYPFHYCHQSHCFSILADKYKPASVRHSDTTDAIDNRTD